MIDERLTGGLAVIVSQLPPLIQRLLDPNSDQAARHTRYQLFAALSQFTAEDLTVDQVTAAQLPELLSLGASTCPPAFLPNQLTVGTVAQQKAGAFAASYLMGQFVNRLGKVGNPPQVVEELTVDGGDFMIAQLQRLQFNYNQHFQVADYLLDVKSRAGLLAAITAKQAAVLANLGPDLVSLAGQIGQTIGSAGTMVNELATLFKQPTTLTTAILTGQYPLPLLFAIEDHPAWFKSFFGQDHRPTPAAFDQAYQFTMTARPKAAKIITEMLSQARLDIKVLPAGNGRKQLLTLVNQLAKAVQ